VTGYLCFVCSANTCRSPMAALVFAEHLRRAGLVRVGSAGIGSWQAGQCLAPRAAAVLTRHGYGGPHTTREFGDDHRDADLFLAAAAEHVTFLRTAVAGPDRVRLLREFDPAAPRNAELADPCHGTPADYENVLAVIERCVPGVLGWLKERV
jgi:protein-tyrosine phosphatase